MQEYRLLDCSYYNYSLILYLENILSLAVSLSGDSVNIFLLFSLIIIIRILVLDNFINFINFSEFFL